MTDDDDDDDDDNDDDYYSNVFGCCCDGVSVVGCVFVGGVVVDDEDDADVDAVEEADFCSLHDDTLRYDYIIKSLGFKQNKVLPIKHEIW